MKAILYGQDAPLFEVEVERPFPQYIERGGVGFAYRFVRYSCDPPEVVYDQVDPPLRPLPPVGRVFVD